MDAQPALVHLEVERLASIGYANNMRKEAIKYGFFFQIVDKTTKISMNILMFWSFFKKNKPYD